MTSGNERPLIIYHDNCADGFCCAHIVHGSCGDEAEYVPAQYGQEPPDVTNRRVYILDFSYKREVMNDIIKKCSSVAVLDHHKTAEKELEGITLSDRVCIVFDMNKSGARLTWEFFNFGRNPHWMVDYTEDRDLWRWKLPNSKEVSAALASYPRDFAVWDEIGKRTPADLAVEGSAILRYQGQLIETICGSAREIEMDGHSILAVNSGTLISEVAGKLAEGRPFAACWFVTKEGNAVWSLRSDKNGVDVSEIAARHGGGGHFHAAGFQQEG